MVWTKLSLLNEKEMRRILRDEFVQKVLPVVPDNRVNVKRHELKLH